MSKQTSLQSFFGRRKDRDEGTETPNRPSDTATVVSCAETAASGTKRARSFQAVWLVKYKWLRYVDGKMFCDTCMLAKSKNNPMTEGCSNFQNSTVSRHQDSKVHLTSLQTLNLRSSFKSAQKSAVQQHDGTLNKYVVQLRTVYTMAKHNIAADVFPDLMLTQSLNYGVKYDYYKRPQAIMEMEECIEKVLSENLSEKIKASDFLGVMLDETCDISVHKKLAIYIRYLDNGEVCVAFVGNEKVTNCTAAGIETALINFLVRKGFADETVSNVMGLGTDGASVMTGRLNGLGAKLKVRNPKLIQVHCVAHRLNLAASQAGRDIEYCKKYHEMIHSLYRFYSDSSVRYDKLRELQELLVGKSSQITEPTSVRWLSVEAAVKNLFANYAPVYQSLESDKAAGKAEGLFRFVSSLKYLLFTAFLIDVLTVIGILSKTFQKDLVNVSHIRQSVSNSIETLNTMKTGSDTVTEVLTEIGDVPAEGVKSKYKGLEVTDNQRTRNEFLNLRESYIDKLVDNLKSRFPSDQLQTLECLDILLNPKRYPDQAGDLADYGRDQLASMLAHFENHVDSDRAKAHFLMYKHFARSQKALSFDKFAHKLISEYEDEYPDYVMLAKVALVIPVSSAPCERGFSVQNAIKNKVRNRLNPERLNRLMFIKLIGPPIEQVDFLPAARIFAQGAQGRL